MPHPLSRNRRIAVVSAASASVLAGSTTLLSAAHPGLSDLARGIGVGFVLGTSIVLLTTSFVFLKRERSACSRTQNPGI